MICENTVDIVTISIHTVSKMHARHGQGMGRGTQPRGHRVAVRGGRWLSSSGRALPPAQAPSQSSFGSGCAAHTHTHAHATHARVSVMHTQVQHTFSLYPINPPRLVLYCELACFAQLAGRVERT